MMYDLVFAGGGAKAMALVGAYDEFIEHRLPHDRLAMRQHLAARVEPDIAVRRMERVAAPTDEANRVARRLLDPDA